MSGGHVRSLPWAWGALGERDTACSTRRSRRSRDMRAGRAPRARQLGSRPRGSTGVLLLDTKVLTATARVSGDALRAGRQVMLGGGFRSAGSVSPTLSRINARRRKWVQLVVVIWGISRRGFTRRTASSRTASSTSSQRLFPNGSHRQPPRSVWSYGRIWCAARSQPVATGGKCAIPEMARTSQHHCHSLRPVADRSAW